MTHPPEPYYSDSQITLYLGDALDTLRRLPDGSVDCCVTSPPYFGLRDYGVDGQYGLESSPAEYVETMRALFAEVRRALADDGTLWLNLGDSYSGADSSTARTKSANSDPASSSASPLSPSIASSHAATANLAAVNHSSSIGPLSGMKQGARNGNRRSRPRGYEGLPAKNLIGIPWRVAFALQDDGWTLRNEIIWHKPNAMPESVSDRLSTRHEHLFLLSKSPRYWFDLDPIREPLVDAAEHHQTWARKTAKERSQPGATVQKRENRIPPGGGNQGTNMVATGARHSAASEKGRNPGDVWSIPTQPFSAAHFAVYPIALPERAILAGCKPGGTVLDPFSGSGTTGLAANKHGRKYVGIDLSRDYLDLSLRTRFAQGGFDFGGVA